MPNFLLNGFQVGTQEKNWNHFSSRVVWFTWRGQVPGKNMRLISKVWGGQEDLCVWAGGVSRLFWMLLPRNLKAKVGEICVEHECCAPGNLTYRRTLPNQVGTPPEPPIKTPEPLQIRSAHGVQKYRLPVRPWHESGGKEKPTESKKWKRMEKGPE